MRVLVLADTHDRLPPHLLDLWREAEEIWHLGDVTTEAVLANLRTLGRPLRVVRGNCDSSEEWPLKLECTIEGWRIMLVHIPLRAVPAGVDLLLHGHTHVPRDEVIGGTRFLNPGCITRPNRGAPASYAWLELAAGEPPGWQVVRV